MKYISNTIASLLLTSSIIACGGGSSTPEVLVDVPPPPAFSFKLLQENDCLQLSPISNVEFLVYNESPNINPNTGYTIFQSNSNGIIELDIDSSAKISFTLNLTDALGDLVSYSFTELAAGNYSMTTLFGESSFTNENCTCQSVDTIDAEVSDNYYFSDIRIASLYGDYNLKGGYVSTSGPAIEFTEHQYCGSDFNGSSLIATAELYGYDDQILYGINRSPSLATISSQTLSLDSVTYSQPRPNLGFEYDLIHSVIFNNQNYLNRYSYNEDSTYFAFDELNPDAHYFNITDSNFTTTYNGIVDSNDIWVFGSKYRREITQSSNPTEVTALATGSELNVSFDSNSKQISWTTDSTSQFNMTYLSRRYVTQSGQTVRHYIYAPYTGSIQIPPNTNAVESEVAASELQTNYVSLISMTGKSSFTNAVETRRFNSDNDSYNTLIEDSTIYSIYYDSNVGNINKQKTFNFESKSAFIKDFAKRNNYKD